MNVKKASTGGTIQRTRLPEGEPEKGGEILRHHLHIFRAILVGDDRIE